MIVKDYLIFDLTSKKSNKICQGDSHLIQTND